MRHFLDKTLLIFYFLLGPAIAAGILITHMIFGWYPVFHANLPNDLESRQQVQQELECLCLLIATILPATFGQSLASNVALKVWAGFVAGCFGALLYAVVSTTAWAIFGGAIN